MGFCSNLWEAVGRIGACMKLECYLPSLAGGYMDYNKRNVCSLWMVNLEGTALGGRTLCLCRMGMPTEQPY